MADEHRIKYFDGIRGIAALWVAIIHFYATFYWTGLDNVNIPFMAIIKRIFLNGDLCIFIFWLLSGIVISYGFLRPGKEPFSKLSEFAFKRYLRLVLPVFFSSLLCFILLKSGLFYFKELSQFPAFSGNVTWLNQFYNFEPNIISFLKITFFDVFLIGNPSYNGPLWTIGPELFGPILSVFILYSYRTNPNKFLLYSIWLLFFFIGGLSNYSFYYYIMFILGIVIIESQKTDPLVQKNLLALVYDRLFNTKLTAYLLFFISFSLEYVYLDDLSHFLSFFTVPLRAISLILIIKNTVFLQKILSLQFFAFIGKISFAVYLLHLPLLLSLISFVYSGSPEFFSHNIFILIVIYLAILVFVSYLFYRFIEEKSITFSQKLAQRITDQNLK